jgi:hypothetical protein
MATNKQNQRIDKLETDLAQLRQRQQALEFFVDELKRKARGITSATSRVAAVERNHNALSGQIEALTNRLNEQRQSNNPESSVLKDIRQHLERIEKAQTTHYEDLDGRLAALSGRVDTLEGAEALKIDFANTRLDLTANPTIDVDTPWLGAFIIGIFAGALSAVALNLWVAQGWEWQKDFWAAVIIGVAALLVFASFEKFTSKVNLSGKLIWAYRDAEKAEPKTPEKTTITAVVDKDKSNTQEKASTGQY